MSPTPRILITRPLGQQEQFVRACEELGLETAHLPCLTIEPLISQHNRHMLQQVQNRVLFTSTNAVHHANQQYPLPWQHAMAHAIGSATAHCLRQYGQNLAFEPLAPFNSEAFLSSVSHLPAQPLTIIKGRGGRTTIADTLESAGWQVSTVDVYSRRCPRDDETDACELLSGTGFELISAGSNETLTNLVHLGRNFLPILLRGQLLVNSHRASAVAREFGFEKPPIVATPAGDEGQLNCIRQWMNRETGKIIH